MKCKGNYDEAMTYRQLLCFLVLSSGSYDFFRAVRREINKKISSS